MSARVQSRWTEAPKLPLGPSLAEVLRAEARALVAALASPQALVREVEAMGVVLAEATRVETHDPVRTRDLREQATRRCT